MSSSQTIRIKSVVLSDHHLKYTYEYFLVLYEFVQPPAPAPIRTHHFEDEKRSNNPRQLEHDRLIDLLDEQLTPGWPACHTKITREQDEGRSGIAGRHGGCAGSERCV